jgi:hypothetical protein
LVAATHVDSIDETLLGEDSGGNSGDTIEDKGDESPKTSIGKKISILKAISLYHYTNQTSLQMKSLRISSHLGERKGMRVDECGVRPAATLVLFAY